jgi:NADPH:quinone reductase-like Zn-dependent oxidoreductase
VRVQGLYVGSRCMHEDLARFVEVARIRPVIDRTFAGFDAAQALHYLAAGRHFGKVALDFA